VSRVVLAYDPTSSINDTVSGRDQGKAYTLKLDDAGTLAFTINMDDHWFFYDYCHKLLAQLCFADASRGYTTIFPLTAHPPPHTRATAHAHNSH
jgi:hypothetical protein